MHGMPPTKLQKNKNKNPFLDEFLIIILANYEKNYKSEPQLHRTCLVISSYTFSDLCAQQFSLVIANRHTERQSDLLLVQTITFSILTKCLYENSFLYLNFYPFQVVSQHSMLLAPLAVDAVIKVIDPAVDTNVNLKDIKVMKQLGYDLIFYDNKCPFFCSPLIRLTHTNNKI